jgi:hypothetical protein
LLPQLSLITYPVKFVTVSAFAVPLLAAFAVARLQEPGTRSNRTQQGRLLFLSGLLLALIAGILLWAWRYPFPGDDFSATFRNGLGRAGFLVCAAVLLLALPTNGRDAFHRIPIVGREGLGRGGTRPYRSWLLMPLALAAPALLRSAATVQGAGLRILPLLLLAGCWLDVWTHEPNQNPTVPPSVYAPGLVRTKLAMKPQPVLGESRAMVTPAAEAKFTGFIVSDPANNFLVKRLGYFSDCNLLDEVPKVNGFLSLYPKECGELTSVLYGSTNASFPRLADFLAVSQITAPGEFYEWVSRDSFLPLVTAGQRPVFLDDTNALRSLIRPDFDGSKVVFLSPEARPLLTASAQTQARVLAQQFAPERVNFEVEAAEASLAVVAQTYYHWWRAKVDGVAVPLLRANYAFQAVEVPPGRHRVELVYQDRSLGVGAVISGLSLAGCVLLWLRRSKAKLPAT